MKKILASSLALVLILVLLSGCEKAQDGKDISSGGSDNGSSSAEPAKVDFSKTDADMFTERDMQNDYDAEKSITVKLNGSSASASSDSVKISGSTVTITENTTHIITGTLDDGMIIVDADKTAKFQLVFNGASINNKDSAALYIRQADKVFVTLANGSENSLSNGGTFTAIDENNIDAALFSKQDLTFNGSGSLTVTSPAGHGIVSKDDLVITGGTYKISCASHGIDANDSVRITGETAVTVDAGKDGIHAENTDDTALGFVYISNGTMDIKSQGDGVSASSYLQLEKGTLKVLAGGGSANGSKESSDSWGGFMGGGRPSGKPRMEPTSNTDESSTSMKGIKADNSLLISGGSITVDSADDAVHSNVSVTVNGGTFELASGDDAIHAEETLTVTGGTINITESYEGLEALDIAVKGSDIKLVALDDGLNAAGGNDSSGMTGGRDGMFGGGMGGHGGMSSNLNGSIVISGGKLNINASGDGIDANGTLEISGGYTVVTGPTQGDTATLDYDKSATITGGTFIGTGASGMAQTFSDSKQGVVSVSVGNQSANTKITLKDKNGKTIITHTPELSFGVVIISSPDIVSGETYSITVGENTGDFVAN